MSLDVLVLNTAVVDFRSDDFGFAERLVGKGGLAKCSTEDMPNYSQEQLRSWIDAGLVTAGGPGNCAPLIARAGLRVGVGANLGRGSFGGLDAQGRYFCDLMVSNDVDMSATFVHPQLATGTTFIYEKDSSERGGIAYFPNANNDFDFEYFKGQVERLQPAIVYYMYSGLSDRGDANGGRDLAEFVGWCRAQGCATIADSHTLTANPQQLIELGQAVEEYRLLEPLLPQLDLFFTSYDEARIIENTLGETSKSTGLTQDEHICCFLDSLAQRFWRTKYRTRVVGVTVSDGAYEKHVVADGVVSTPTKIQSKFVVGEVIDLVGAGDSFRAGLISYVAENIEAFKAGSMNFTQAVQMGNLFASLYIKAPLQDRYGNIRAYERMLDAVVADKLYRNLEELMEQIKQD